MAEKIYTPELCDKIIEMFEDGSSITQVCARKLKVHRDTYYEWKNLHPEFKRAAETGEQVSQAHWEDIGKDGIVGDLEKFAGSSWQFVMKNRFRDSFSDQQPTSVNDTLIEKLLEKL